MMTHTHTHTHTHTLMLSVTQLLLLLLSIHQFIDHVSVRVSESLSEDVVSLIDELIGCRAVT